MKGKRLLAWRLWLVRKLWPSRSSGLPGEMGACAARTWRKLLLNHLEYTLTVRDIRHPDVYSREEVYRMLWTVRENERRMGWICPEPPTELLGVWQVPGNQPTIQVIVNGEPRIITGMDVAGPDVAALAGMSWFPGLSITWRTGDGQAFGTLYGERKVAVQDGMIFNCYHTGNA